MNDKKEKESSEEQYNPYEHRRVEKPVSDIRSTANLIKSSLGSGLLAGPLAFSNAGWGIGLLGTVLIGVLCGHCIHILVKTSRGCCLREKKASLNYAETCAITFSNGPKSVRPFAGTASIFQLSGIIILGGRSCAGKASIMYRNPRAENYIGCYKTVIVDYTPRAGNIIAEFALVSTYVGVCCIYTVLISDSLKQIVDRYAPSVILPVEYYSLIMLVPICILCQIKYLKWLAVFSLVANVLLVATYLICLYYIFGGEISFADKIAIGSPARYPAFLSTVIFAMEGIGVVMPVENEMKKPRHFLGCPSVLTVAMSVIVFLYSTLGLFGYFRYGDVLKGSITLNLPIDDWPAVCAKIFIAVSIFLTYPLQFFVVIDIFTKHTQQHIKENYRFITQLAARIGGVIFCVAIGIALPMLEQIINLVGAAFYSILGLIIPAVVETVFRWDNLGRFNWILWKNLFIVIFGFFILISGCTTTILDIIRIINSKRV